MFNDASSSRKGQAAIEYLMNYAWAIALIIIVGVAIFGLNIGEIRTSLTSQSSELTQAGERVAVIGQICDSSGDVQIALQNNGPSLVKNIQINVSNESTTLDTDCSGSTDLFPGDTVTCSNSTGSLDCGDVGDTYEIQVDFSYLDDRTDLEFTPTRNFTGEVQSA